MKIYDISQPVRECRTWPDHPIPGYRLAMSIKRGDEINLSCFSMCVHNGTHVDAPSHFLAEGKGLASMGLKPFVGMAYVAEIPEPLTAESARALFTKAWNAGCRKRILFKGPHTLTLEAAQVFAKAKMNLLGCEPQGIGDTPVHRTLLEAEVCILEGLDLKKVKEGPYMLNAAPLNLGEVDGSPCRAILIQEDK